MFRRPSSKAKVPAPEQVQTDSGKPHTIYHQPAAAEASAASEIFKNPAMAASLRKSTTQDQPAPPSLPRPANMEASAEESMKRAEERARKLPGSPSSGGSPTPGVQKVRSLQVEMAVRMAVMSRSLHETEHISHAALSKLAKVHAAQKQQVQAAAEKFKQAAQQQQVRSSMQLRVLAVDLARWAAAQGHATLPRPAPLTLPRLGTVFRHARQPVGAQGGASDRAAGGARGQDARAGDDAGRGGQEAQDDGGRAG